MFSRRPVLREEKDKSKDKKGAGNWPVLQGPLTSTY
jgi:hypothetical protein